MAKRVTSTAASASIDIGTHHIANALAIGSGSLPIPVPVVIDQNLSPPSAPLAVVLPLGDGLGCNELCQPDIFETEAVIDITEVIEPEYWSALSEDERRAYVSQPMPIARLAIDQVRSGLVRTVLPSIRDVAAVPSPETRAEIMLALGWLAATCGCLRALMNSLPDDSLPGFYVRAGAELQTPEQLAEVKLDEQRRHQRSQDWSAYLKAKAQQRRHQPAGDLFATFHAGTTATALPPV